MGVMNIPDWAMVPFIVVGFGFMLLGPFLPIINLMIFVGAILVLLGIGATMAAMIGFYSTGKPATTEKPAKFVTVGNEVFAVIDGHINGTIMTKRQYQDYMNDVTQARDETGKVLNLPVCNTPYQMVTGDPTAGGHSGDWRDEA
jgi:NADH:ubiquinone oxidoreductase subunit 6 (subunit J)